MPFVLDESELQAVCWSLRMARAVALRAAGAGRLPAGQIDVAPPAELIASLKAGVLAKADADMVIAPLQFAISLYGPGMQDIRQVLEPPASATLISAITRISPAIGADVSAVSS